MSMEVYQRFSWREDQITMSRSVSRVDLQEILRLSQIYTCANRPLADLTYQLRCPIFSYCPFFGIHMEVLDAELERIKNRITVCC